MKGPASEPHLLTPARTVVCEKDVGDGFDSWVFVRATGTVGFACT